MKVEKRALVVGDLQVRAADDGDGEDGFTVRGHALTFDDPYEVWDFEEQWDAGAVRDDIQDTDVFAFWSHDSSIPLARTTNGSLELRKDDVGLAVEFTLPATRQQEAEAIRTGLVDKMSVGFYVKRQRWEEREDLPDLRTILEAELLEVSPVALPANPNTDLSPREQKHLVEARRQCLGPDCKVPAFELPDDGLSSDQVVGRLADELAKRMADKYATEGRSVLEGKEDSEVRKGRVTAVDAKWQLQARTCNPENRGEALGNLISDLQDETDLTNDELGAAAGISGSTVSQIKSGSIMCPPIGRLTAMAEALGTPVADLVAAAEQDGCMYEDEE